MAADERDWFRSEYEVELSRFFKRRFLWLAVAYIAFELLGVALIVATQWSADATLDLLANDRWPVGVPRPDTATIIALGGLSRLQTWLVITLTLIIAGIAALFGLVRRRAISGRDELIHEASIMIVLVGVAQAALDVYLGLNSRHGFSPLTSLFFWHFTACLFLPWSPLQSLKPIAPLLVIYMLADLLLPLPVDAPVIVDGVEMGTRWWTTALARTIALPFVLAPGLLLCWLRLRRHGSRFRTKRFRDGFVNLRRELASARAIHESIFPGQDPDAAVPFRYTFKPAQDLGGDFPATWVRDDGARMVLLVDVFGHGLRSALAVQRLAGEIERLRLEDPLIDPAALMGGLHRYCELVLSRHQSYATAICAKIDPAAGTMTFTNAAHPPAFVRAARGGAPRSLDANAGVLGIPDQEPLTQETVSIGPGDAFIAYTDGVIEAQNPSRHSLGLDNLRATLSRRDLPIDVTAHLAALVDSWTRGRRDDDVLVVMAGPMQSAPTVMPTQVAGPVAEAAHVG
ncbi:MAG: serine/threonine-protein phosphatase [Phycisphaerae bacterium]|nr:serine/threonine-protein phosphatase [Phycisphaerae bacterium]